MTGVPSKHEMDLAESLEELKEQNRKKKDVSTWAIHSPGQAPVCLLFFLAPRGP